MKRFLSVALAILMVLSAFLTAGCAKKEEKGNQKIEAVLNIEDVKADPAKHLSDAINLTFKETIFSALPEKLSAITIDASSSGESGSTSYTIFADPEAMKLALKAESTSEAPDEGYGEDFEDTTATFDLYFADNTLVVDSEILAMFFGTEVLGLSLESDADAVQNSAIFDLITQIEGLEDLDAGIFDSFTNNAGLEKIIDMYLDSMKKTIENDLFKLKVEEESSSEKTEEKDIVITATLDEKVYSGLIDDTASTLQSLLTLTETEGSDDIIEGFKESFPKGSFSIKFNISQATGTIVKISGKATFEVTDAETEEKTESSLDFQASFGTDPAALCPSFTVTSTIDGHESKISGETTHKDGTFTVKGDVNYVEVAEAYDDEGNIAEEEVTDHVVNYTFTYDKKGDFTLKFAEKDEEKTIKGSFTWDDKGIKASFDLSEAFPEASEDEELGMTVELYDKVEISVTFGGKMPAIPEYTDILDLTEDDLSMLQGMIGMMNGEGGEFGDLGDLGGEDIFGDYEMDYSEALFNEVLWYAECSEEELEDLLATYADEGFEDEYSYLCALYITYATEDLTTNYGATEDMILDFLEGLSEEGYSATEAAAMLFDSYFEFTIPTVDEILEMIENYEDFGFEAAEDVIPYLEDVYEYFELPEELQDLAA